MSELPNNHLKSILERLQSGYEDVSSLVAEVQDNLIALSDSEITQDYEKIRLSLENFSGLLQDEKTQDVTGLLADPAHMRLVRHDLRGTIGAVIGYSEMIYEGVEEAEGQDLASVFRQLSQKASDLLPTIDALSVTDVQATLLEHKKQPLTSHLILGSVLIVDDNQQKQDLLKRKLERVGHTITVAKSGEEAIGLMHSPAQTPDIILLDLYMPEMNGDEVLKIIKQETHLKDIPVLMVSSSSDMDNVAKCIQLGADDYLPMPIDETLLHARLNACLTKKQARDRELKAQQELEQARVRLNMAINNMEEGFAVFDEHDELVVFNHYFQELYTGLSVFPDHKCTYEQLMRANIEKNVYLFDRRDATEDRPQEDFIEDWVQRKLSYHRNPGRPQLDLLSNKKWVEVIENKIPGGGVVAIHKDISKVKEKEEKLEYLGLHDGLTGLANRKKFDTILEQFVQEYKQGKQKTFAVVFFDLDGFKNVNDTLGHDFGDYLLQTVAQKLGQCVREEDLVARFGGDEFAAIISNLDSSDRVTTFAQRCLDTIGESVEKDGVHASFGVSIGIAVCPDNGQDAATLLKQADASMYLAKKQGKGRYCFPDQCSV